MNKFFSIFIFILSLNACGILDVFADQQKPGEYQIKAAYLYNFINFIDWPNESNFYNSPSLNLCIFGDDPFGNNLDDIRNEIVRGKKITVKYTNSLDKLRSCNILFIPASERNHVLQILKLISNSNVLTVSDVEESAHQGVIISFFVEQKKVRFAINIEAARRAGFKISAKLLKLSKIINVTKDQ
jgi:hypothetical protein